MTTPSGALAPVLAPTLVDRSTFGGAVLLGLVPVALAGLVVLVKWWRGRDEVWSDVTPGLVPSHPSSAPTHRARGGEWHGTVAPQFTPPAGVRPGVVGTVVDGRADAHDVSATILDLAVRGWFRIRRVPVGTDDAPAPPPSSAPADAPADPGRKADWELVRAEDPPAEALTRFERLLVDRFFADGERVRLGTLRGSFGVTMREVQIGLYQEVVDRGWYARHPRARNNRTRALGLVVLVPLVLLAAGVLVSDLAEAHDWSLAPLLVGAVVALVLLARWGGARTPRTAAGSAARIQALGFREYLATAEAQRLGWEEKRALLSTWLPYAVAFGLTAHLARVVGDLARETDWTDHVDALGWWDGSLPVDGLGDGFGDGFDLPGGLADLGDLVPDLDAFTGATDSLFSFDGVGCGDGGDGCSGLDGCDGCDLPGCDF